MDHTIRVGLFLALLGVGVVSGTLIESITPLSIVAEPAIAIMGYQEETILNHSLLFARNFRLVIHILEGGPIKYDFFQIGGNLHWSGESNSTIYRLGSLHTRGLFILTLQNPSETPVTVRVFLDQFGEDREQILLGLVIFITGFILCLIWLSINWNALSKD